MTTDSDASFARYKARHHPDTMATRLVRLLQLRQAIIDQPGISRSELARRFGVSERRINQDLWVLRLAGIRVVKRGRSGYWVEE